MVKMRFVLDQNYSRTPELENYLKSGNEIIFTDDFLVEPFKSKTATHAIYRNFEILRKFPSQVFATYDRGELYRKELSICSPLKPDQLISSDRTEKVRHLLRLDKMSLNGVLTSIQSDSTNRIIYQANFLEKYIREGAQQVTEDIDKLNKIKSDRNQKLRYIQENSFQILEHILRENCLGKYDFEQFKINNSIIFSFNYILLWRKVEWAIKNGFQNAKKSIHGDSFDIKYVLIACFFDGIMTKEEWLKQCREDTLSNFTKLSKS